MVDVYRSPPPLGRWHVECRVRGPFGPIVVSTVIWARCESEAVHEFEEDTVEQGFTLSGHTKAWRLE